VQSELTRGGRKLEAAVAHFALRGRIAGGAAIDVGASTGGFVHVMLACGADHVTAIDVGHGQLAPTLARDARVTNLEHTDFKTLSLGLAPGPFDFFTVDVSFVAARSMLRGLAFRLRPGAEGVVLVKPQFELPDHLVKGGRVDAPELRQRALDDFRGKAERLGFTVLDVIDSPVAGGSGTVEMLAHLRFAGRPDTMPKPGQRLPERSPLAKSASLPSTLRWFAVASPGLEAPLAEELSAIGAATGGAHPGVTKVRAVEGGVEFSGPLRAGIEVNRRSRIATRILLRLGEVKAREFARLRHALAKLPWPAVIPRDRPLRIDASTTHCRLFHTGALAETVTLAIADCVGKLPVREKKADAEDEDCTRVLLRGQDDKFVVSVDSSGALLHRRGWRLEAGRAPLRETLAAGILALCKYDPALPLLDPMCGSGTFAIEAAAVARAIAPGAGRSFAFERWPALASVAAEHARVPSSDEALPSAPPEAVASIFASDRDARAVETARRNAERAGVLDAIAFSQASLGKGRVPTQPGLVVINPPYGRRLGDRRHALRLGHDIGQTLSVRFSGWRAAVLCPDQTFVNAVASGARRKPSETFALRNGGLRVLLALWQA
jgi:putative N6-adenine-specific DNA methylase